VDNRRLRNGFSWFAPAVLAPLAVGSCLEDGDRFVVPYRTGSVAPRVATGGSRSSGGASGSGGVVDSGSGAAPDSDVTTIDGGSGGAPSDTGAGGASGSGGVLGDGSVCGCPPLYPLTPCCTTQRTCGYVVGAGCFPYVPGTGGRGAGDSGTDGRDAASDGTIQDAASDGSDG
jgi:hypothetical protein